MFAVIKTGGKQYIAEAGKNLKIEKLADAKVKGDKISFDQIFLVADGSKVEIGQPIVKGAKVEGTLVRNFKDKKIDVFKYKSKTRYRRRYGHRQQLAEVKIESVTM